MKKTLKLMLAGAFALLAFSACSDDEEPFVEPNPGSESEDAYYASLATISSSDSKFTKTDEGGSILFTRDGGTAIINVNCGTAWYAASTGGTWLDVDANNTSGTMTVTASASELSDDRTAKIILSTAIEGISFATVTVSQSGDARVDLSPEWLVFYEKGESLSTTVIANYDWNYSYDTSNGWFNIERDGNILTVTTIADNNTEKDLEGIVTITAGEGDNICVAQLTIVECSPSMDDMILVYTITEQYNYVKIPICGTVDCIVDWGDGTIETITEELPDHQYTAHGEYKIRISGTVTGLSSESIFGITAYVFSGIEQWGRTGLTSMDHACYYAQSLGEIPSPSAGSFDEVTNFSYAFAGCTALKCIPEDLFKYSTMATSLARVFYNCSAITEIPNGLLDPVKDNTSLKQAFYGMKLIETIPEGLLDYSTKVEDMGSLFYNWSALTKIPEGLFDNCSAVTDFSYVFYGCKLIPEIPVGLFANCPKVTTFDAAFYNCSTITEVPNGLFDTCTEVTDFSFLFYGCSNLKTIPSGLFDNCTKVTNFGRLFYNCKVLEAIPAGLFDNCPEVTDFSFVFYGCYIVPELPAGIFDNCPKVTTFNASIYQLKAITTIPDGLFANCPDVENFEWCFGYCESLETLPTDLFANNTKVTDFYWTFYGCTSVVGQTPYNEIDVDGEKVQVRLWEREKYEDYFIAPTKYGACFRNCGTLTDYDEIPDDWK